MTRRVLLADIGLAMLIALPAIAPATPSPRTVEPAVALANRTAEPAMLADGFHKRNAQLPESKAAGL